MQSGTGRLKFHVGVVPQAEGFVDNISHCWFIVEHRGFVFLPPKVQQLPKTNQTANDPEDRCSTAAQSAQRRRMKRSARTYSDKCIQCSFVFYQAGSEPYLQLLLV